MDGEVSPSRTGGVVGRWLLLRAERGSVRPPGTLRLPPPEAVAPSLTPRAIPCGAEGITRSFRARGDWSASVAIKPRYAGAMRLVRAEPLASAPARDCPPASRGRKRGSSSESERRRLSALRDRAGLVAGCGFYRSKQMSTGADYLREEARLCGSAYDELPLLSLADDVTDALLEYSGRQPLTRRMRTHHPLPTAAIRRSSTSVS